MKLKKDRSVRNKIASNVVVQIYVSMRAFSAEAGKAGKPFSGLLLFFQKC